MKKKMICFIIIDILLAVFCMISVFLLYDKHEFGYISLVLAVDEEHNLVVDENDDSVYLLYTEQGKIIREISFDKIDGSNVNEPEYLFMDGEDVYLQSSYYQAGHMRDVTELYRLDMEHRQMIKVASEEDSQIKKMSSDLNEQQYAIADIVYTVTDGQIKMYMELYCSEDKQYYFSVANKVDGEWVLQEKKTVLDNYFELYYPAGNTYLGIGRDNQLATGNGADKHLSTDEYYQLYSLGNGLFAGRNMSSGTIDKIDCNTKTVEVYDEELLQKLSEASCSIQDVRSFSAYNDRVLLSTYPEEQSVLAEYRNGTFHMTSTLYHMDVGQRIFAGIGILFGSTIFTAMLFLLHVYVIRRYLIVKIAVILIPVLLVCDWAAYAAIQQIMDSENEESFIRSLTQIGEQYEALDLTSAVKDFSDKESEDVIQFQKLLQYISECVSYFEEQKDTEDFLYTTIDYYGLDKNRNTFIKILDEGNDKTLEESGSEISKAVENMKKTGEPVSCKNYSKYGVDVIFLLYPTTDANGEINGCYFLMAFRSDMDYESGKFMNRILRYEMVVNLVLAAIILILTGISLHPLSGLQRRAKKLLQGEDFTDSKKRKEKKYLNEFDLISARFDEMSGQVQKNMDEINRLKESSQIYFSGEILKALEKRSIALLNFRENVTEEFYIVRVELPPVYDDFQKYKKFVQKLSGQLELYQGFIGDICGSSIFICSKQRKLQNLMFFIRKENPDIRAVFDKTPVQISVVGQKEEYCFSVTVSDKNRQNILSAYHDSVQANLLAAGNALENADLAFSLSCVGMFGNQEPVYEITDGSWKWKFTRQLMQKAVTLYYQGSFTQARFLFARVLMKNPKNPAAAYYIRCIEEAKEHG